MSSTNMSSTLKQVLAFGCAVIVGMAIYGAYKYPVAGQNQMVGTSTAGSTFNNAKFSGITVNLAAPGANATSSSILNTDASDRFITVMRYACQGIGTSRVAYSGGGLDALKVTAATSSTAAPTTNTNVNSVNTGSTNIGTSTTQTTIASSTSGSTNISLVWAAGSYMTFTTNATNTAQCTFGVDYIAS